MKRLPPAAAFLLAACLFGCAPQPHIESISPRIGNMGELMTVQGKGFGAARGESHVSIAGISPTSSSYVAWSDGLITVRVPEFGESGLVYVHVGSRRSNAALFTNRSTMPRPVVEAADGGAPRIQSIDPVVGAIGSTLTISGRNFGPARSGGAVLFAWEAEVPPAAPAALKAPDAIEASDDEFDYEEWSDREIRVRVPDGAISGTLTVRTPSGTSDPVFLGIADKPGIKTFKDKRSYAVSYSVNVKDVKASGQNALYLWMPRPVASASQRAPQLIAKSMDPFVSSQRSALLFQLRNINSATNQTIELSWVVDVYAVETQVKVQAVKKESGSPIQAGYTTHSALIPSENAAIRDIAATIGAKEKVGYARAKLAYDWMLQNIRISPRGASDAVGALASRSADPLGAALLFCALARALDVPAIPCSGFVVDLARNQTPHWWAEFWVDGFGWIPVDPSMATLAGTGRYPSQPDAAAYYFGNMDNQRICFSRGFAQLTQMDPRGRVTVRDRAYALQSIWEEAVGGIESYSSLWSGLTITGVY